MKVSVRPGKRDGLPKLLFDRDLEWEDLQAAPEGGVILTFVANDIYTANASQRFSIVLSRSELEMICKVDVAETTARRAQKGGESSV